MYCMPIFAVPKEDPGEFRLVTHQSYGDFSLNSMSVPHARPFPMDNMVRLGDLLLRAHKEKLPGQRLILWKSDVSEAYRLLPMHPYWQIKQINTVDGERHVDRNAAFGGRRSGDIFIGFIALVLWIAKFIYGVENPSSWMDDCFGLGYEGDVTYYAPYRRYIPTNQAKLLQCWDNLGIPHKEHKQLSGPILKIIGLLVDPNELTITLPEEGRQNFLEEINRYIIPSGGSPRRYTVRDWQHLAGYSNWAFNVFPLLRPMLSNVYDRINRVTDLDKRVKVTRAVSNDLSWARNYIKSLSGIHLIREHDWTLNDASIILYTDACLSGLGIWSPREEKGFYHTFTDPLPSNFILYRKALATLTAIEYAIQTVPWKSRIVIYSDNANVVSIFNTLAAKPLYNPLVKHAVDLLLASDCQLRVLWVSTDENAVADALSRRDMDRTFALVPTIHVSTITPP
ncbi:hypothetical protein NP233_g2118 [Leucocoprinus birnbaumii]|uniref:Uncharacterized protein n=1 Tax=Leucocoprinus birnbaumii TaxID=56174 RepID=A0AAD5W4W7_9AGAR|nr:hypothetical protein NP233_g2118 [Leucocoprinus birnbaumii]